MNIKILILAIVSALVPVLFWFYIIKRKKREKMMLRFIITFLLAGAGAVVFFNFIDQIQDYLSSTKLSFFMTFVLFGIVIEYFKNIVVRIGGIKYFRDVDDVMDLSFASALGFTFFENIFYFYIAFSGHNPEIVGPVKMLKYFLMREFFILPIHLFCSGIFGYFYGIGIFAGDELKRQNHKDLSYRMLHIFSRLIFVSEDSVFRVVKIMQGTILSVFFYALFFTFLQYDPMVSDVMKFLGADWFFRTTESGGIKPFFDEHLMPVVSFAFFQVGTVTLFYLLDQKKKFESRALLTKI